MSDIVLPKRLFDVKTVSIIEPKNLNVDIKYVTVTHVWGIDRYSVCITGINWIIPWDDKTVKKIAKILCELGINYVWIDILCIDQESNEDKENEVRKMALYYKRADACLLIDKHNLDDIRPLYDAANKDLGGFDVEEDHLMMLHVFCTAYFSTWMSRMWTYQEVALSNRIWVPVLIDNKWKKVDIGVHSTVAKFRSEYTMKYSCNLERIKSGNEEKIWKSIKAFEDILKIRTQNTDDITLGKAIKLTYGRKASDDHDYIYGLLGIVKGGDKVPIIYNNEKSVDSFKRVCVALGNSTGDWSVIYAASTNAYSCLISNKLNLLLPDAYKYTATDDMYATSFDDDKLNVKTYVSKVIKEAYTFRVRELVAGDVSSAIHISVLTSGRLAEVISSITVFTDDNDRWNFLIGRSKAWCSYDNLYKQALYIDAIVQEKKPRPDLSDIEINRILGVNNGSVSLIGSVLNEISDFMPYNYEGNKSWVVNTGDKNWHIVTTAQNPVQGETYIVGRNIGVNTRIVVRKKRSSSFEKIGVAFGTLKDVTMKTIGIKWSHIQYPPQNTH